MKIRLEGKEFVVALDDGSTLYPQRTYDEFRQLLVLMFAEPDKTLAALEQLEQEVNLEELLED